jgi:hypothetical protein
MAIATLRTFRIFEIIGKERLKDESIERSMSNGHGANR